MSHRFNAFPKKNYGVSGVANPYSKPASTFSLPPNGIEDVDASIFKLFDKELPLTVSSAQSGKESQSRSRVHVLFASGEKWALHKKNTAYRDKNGSVVLPLISIQRTAMAQTSNDIVGRGMNQMQGEIVIKRRLDKADRDYQNLVNKVFLRSQVGTALPSGDDLLLGQVSTDGENGQRKNEPLIIDGGILSQDNRRNVIETLVVPAPQFYTVSYEVMIWTQYTQHMNQIVEGLLSSYLPQQRGWTVTTDAGYWFNVFVSEEISPENNFDDMSSTERVVKSKFTIEVPTYIFASTAPGVPIQVRRYVSYPQISFDVASIEDAEIELNGTTVTEPFLGADDPTLPLSIERTIRADQRLTNRKRLYVAPNEIDEHDPKLTKLERGYSLSKWRRVSYIDDSGNVVHAYERAKNPHGESVIDTSELEMLSKLGLNL